MDKIAVPLALFLLTSVALADDGWVGNGGSPSTMTGKHPTIRMADEVVKIRIGKKTTSVDCIFHFVNDGPATTVKMGFPDVDSQREEPKDGTVFRKYESWVDGKRTACKFEGDFENGFWQTKSIAFSAHQRRTVRDRYTVLTGAGFEGGQYYMRYASYILHTGGTWKGTIGRVEVQVEFDPSYLRPNRIASLDDFVAKVHPKDGYMDEDRSNKIAAVMKRNQRTVFWSGPCAPTFVNGRITFVINNLNPTEKDDIDLSFGPYRGSEEAHQSQ